MSGDEQRGQQPPGSPLLIVHLGHQGGHLMMAALKPLELLLGADQLLVESVVNDQIALGQAEPLLQDMPGVALGQQ